jgi:hypothetical protein
MPVVGSSTTFAVGLVAEGVASVAVEVFTVQFLDLVAMVAIALIQRQVLGVAPAVLPHI